MNAAAESERSSGTGPHGTGPRRSSGTGVTDDRAAGGYYPPASTQSEYMDGHAVGFEKGFVQGHAKGYAQCREDGYDRDAHDFKEYAQANQQASVCVLFCSLANFFINKI